MNLKIIIQKEIASVPEAKFLLAQLKNKLDQVADIDYSVSLAISETDIESS